MKRVIVLRAIPGGGKSFWIKEAFPEHARQWTPDLPEAQYVVVVSADDFFMVDGEYVFDRAMINEAHTDCLHRFIFALDEGPDGLTIVVDNTNLRIAELAPYAALAKAGGHELAILNFWCQPEVAIHQQSHGLDVDDMMRMHLKFLAETPLIPPWWKQHWNISNCYTPKGWMTRSWVPGPFPPPKEEADE
jgi:hypothetical protein